MTTPSFIHSPEVQYSCTLCGECCRERWRVPLDEPTCHTLLKQDWQETPLAEQAEKNPEFFIQRVPTLPTGAAFQTHAGGCVFLDTDGLCLLHKHQGASAKGIVCRLFPYLFVDAPEGVYVGYSFVCRPVRLPDELETANTILEESEASTFEEARGFYPGIHYQQVPEQVELGWDILMTWKSYLELESGLIEILQHPDVPFSHRLVAGHAFLNLAGLFLKEFAEIPPEEREDKVTHYVEAMRKERYARVIRIAERSRGRRLIRRYVLSVILGLHEAGVKAREKRDKGAGDGTIRRMALISRMFRHFFKPAPPVREIKDILSESAGRYLRHFIWRKGLVLGRSLYRMEGICRGYALLLIAYALIEHYTGYYVKSQEPEAAVAEAIRTVERDFILHAGRDATGSEEGGRESYELFLSLVDSLVTSKSFAPSLVGW